MSTPWKNNSTPYRSTRTEFGGIFFRSRLEARWAAFYRALGIQFFYEPLIRTLRRHPDFWLPSLQAYVEIKPNSQKKDVVAETKAQDLTKFSRKPVYLFFTEVRPPNLSEPEGSAWVFYPDRVEKYHHWCECPKCGNITIASYRNSIADWSCSACGHIVDYTNPLPHAFQSSRLMEAYKKAEVRFPYISRKEDTEWVDDDWEEDDWDRNDLFASAEYDLEENPSIWDLAPEMRLEWDDWESREDEEDN